MSSYSQHLVEKGLVSIEDIDTAERLCQEQGLRLDQALIQNGAITEQAFLEVMGERLDFDVIDLPSASIENEAIKTLPSRFVYRNHLAPIARENGGLKVAINAMQSVREPHHFLGINHQGKVSVVSTSGNAYAHLVLRGGNDGPNFDVISVGKALDSLVEGKLREKIMIDCNHANSGKDPYQQELVLRAVLHQIKDGRKALMGTMIESNLEGGNQSIGPHMKYGVSVTDACLDWENTRRIILEADKMLLS